MDSERGRDIFATICGREVPRKVRRETSETHLAAFRVLEVLVVMIVIVEVARGESDVVAATPHLAHQRLLPLHLHLLRVGAQISDCK